MLPEVVHDHYLIRDLFVSPRPIYISRKREANKDVLVVFAVFNIHTKFEGAFEKTIVLSGPIPAQAAVNKGHDIVACVQDPVSEC